MAFTFPREMPVNLRMQECWFELQDNVAFQPSGNNRVNLSQINPPAWKGMFVTAPLTRVQEPLWTSWRNSLRGGLGTFKAFDVRRKTPLAYLDAKAPGDISSGWNGLASVSGLALSGDRRLLGLTGLPTAYQIKTGDRIGLEQNGFIGYYDVLEDVTASGGAATVTVLPFLHTKTFTTSAVARIWRPMCKFVIDSSSWSASGKVEDSAISFNGIQRL